MLRVESKFKPQRVENIYGNDFLYLPFCTKVERVHRHYRAFLLHGIL